MISSGQFLSATRSMGRGHCSSPSNVIPAESGGGTVRRSARWRTVRGAVDHSVGHRCAGEWLTVALGKRAVRLPTTAMRYDLPPQSRGSDIDFSRVPVILGSRCRITDVRPVG